MLSSLDNAKVPRTSGFVMSLTKAIPVPFLLIIDRFSVKEYDKFLKINVARLKGVSKSFEMFVSFLLQAVH